MVNTNAQINSEGKIYAISEKWSNLYKWSKYKFDVNNKVLCVPSNMKAKVIKRFKICPEDEDWINVQEPSITDDEFYGNWYDVLIFQRLGNSRRRYNGCICIPESRLSLLQPDFSPN